MQLIQRISLLIACALAAAAAQAQGVFRSVMPDGKIVYGDKPAPGAKESKQVTLPPANIVAPIQPSSGAGDAPPVPDSRNSDIAVARQNLEAAQRALEAGREPNEGERTGIANKGGGARTQLNEGYFQRIKALEDAVTAAQTQLDAAQRAGR